MVEHGVEIHLGRLDSLRYAEAPTGDVAAENEVAIRTEEDSVAAQPIVILADIDVKVGRTEREVIAIDAGLDVPIAADIILSAEHVREALVIEFPPAEGAVDVKPTVFLEKASRTHDVFRLVAARTGHDRQSAAPVEPAGVGIGEITDAPIDRVGSELFGVAKRGVRDSGIIAA